MLSPVIIEKLDGGYLLICNGKMVIKTTFEDAAAQIKTWTEKPPMNLKEKICDLFGFDPKEDKSTKSPDWVNGFLNQGD